MTVGEKIDYFLYCTIMRPAEVQLKYDEWVKTCLSRSTNNGDGVLKCTWFDEWLEKNGGVIPKDDEEWLSRVIDRWRRCAGKNRVVIFQRMDNDVWFLMVKRWEPYLKGFMSAGQWSFPGDYVEDGKLLDRVGGQTGLNLSSDLLVKSFAGRSFAKIYSAGGRNKIKCKLLDLSEMKMLSVRYPVGASECKWMSYHEVMDVADEEVKMVLRDAEGSKIMSQYILPAVIPMLELADFSIGLAAVKKRVVKIGRRPRSNAKDWTKRGILCVDKVRERRLEIHRRNRLMRK